MGDDDVFSYGSVSGEFLEARTQCIVGQTAHLR